jgi:hypothetical protein
MKFILETARSFHESHERLKKVSPNMSFITVGVCEIQRIQHYNHPSISIQLGGSHYLNGVELR